MNLLMVGLVLLGFAIFGGVVGFTFYKISAIINEVKVKKNMMKVLRGEKENMITLENGKKQEVSKFIVKDEKDNIVIIDFKGKAQEILKNGPTNN